MGRRYRDRFHGCEEGCTIDLLRNSFPCLSNLESFLLDETPSREASLLMLRRPPTDPTAVHRHGGGAARC